jgi:hypothetical protein
MDRNGNILKFTSREVQLGRLPAIADIVELPALHACVLGEMQRRHDQAAVWGQSPLVADKGYARLITAEAAELSTLAHEMSAILSPDPVDAVENYANRTTND